MKSMKGISFTAMVALAFVTLLGGCSNDSSPVIQPPPPPPPALSWDQANWDETNWQ